MRSTIMALIFILIGAAVGGVLALGFGAGMGAAGGLLMGAQAGVCIAADNARKNGMSDPKTLNAIIMESITSIRAKAASVPTQAGIEWVQDASGCAELLDKFSDEPKRKEG